MVSLARLTSKFAKQSTLFSLLLVVVASLLSTTCPHAAARTVRVGIYNFKPLVYSDTDGSVHGLFVTILDHVAKKKEWNVQYVPGTWQEGMDRLKSDQIDLLVCIGYTEERAKLLDFPKEFLLLDWGIIYKTKGSSISTIMDLEGKTVSALKGSVYSAGFQELVKQFHINVKMLDANQMTDVFKAVDSGKAQVGATSNILGILNETGHEVERTPIFFTPVKLGYGANKGKNGDLIEALDSEIAALKADRTSVYYHDLEHLLGKKDTKIPKEVYWGVFGTVVVLLFVIAWNIMLKRQVRAKTEHLEVEIVERKQAEELIKVSEERLRAIMDNTDSVIYMKDVDSKYITINRRFEDLFKVSRNDVLGKTDYDIFPTKIAAAFQENDHTMLNLGKPLSLEEIAPHDDGNHTYISIKFPLFGADGRPVAVCGISNDITERKKAEETLKESEYRWGFALEGAGDGVWDWNIQTGEAFYSRRYKEMLGFAENEIGNSPDEWLKRIHPEDASGTITALQPYLDGNTGAAKVEFRMLCKDGSWKWILGRGMVVSRDSDGKPVRMIGTNTDITEHKSEEEQIKSLTQRLLLATSSAHLGVWDWNVKENIMVWDDRMFELYGITREAFPSNIDAWMNGLHPEDKEIAIAECQSALKGEKEFDTVFRVLHPDGTVKYLKANALVIRGTDGIAERMLGINADITENKLAEIKLGKQNSLLEALLNNLQIGVYLIEVPSGKPLLANEASLQILGRGILPEANAGSISSVYDLYKSDTNEPYPNEELPLVLAMSGVSKHVDDMIVVKPDGARTALEVFGSPLKDESGNIWAGLVSFQDITSRKSAEEEKQALEQQFMHTQKLESLGVLAGGIAHDFNNILAIIVGYCGLTKMDYEDAEKHIPEIEKAAERAAALCRQMLAYAGKTILTQSQVNTEMLVDEMATMLKTTVQKNVVIRPHLGTDIPFIMGDASQIRQVVMNLIINSAEAIGDAEGEIEVKLAKAEIRAEQPEKDHLGFFIPAGRYICFEVTDNGCGMDEDTRRKIFEPFYTTKFAGRGLGMSAVLGIIKSHNGALQMESQPGLGTTFKVYLPVQISSAEAEEAQQKAVSAAWHGSGTILLAEDEAQVKTIAIALLKKLGFSVIDAANGKEAIELYQQNAADITIVITDMGMPVMNGYELFYRLKQLNTQLPIIISSGFGESDIASKIPHDEIAGFINKPYNFEQLREVLRGALERTKSADACLCLTGY